MAFTKRRNNRTINSENKKNNEIIPQISNKNKSQIGKPITIKDVASICGVGVSTVSRAMNNHPDISEATKTKILQTIQEYHYIPNNSARNLKRSHSKIIAVLVKGITNSFFNKMIQVFEDKIQENGYFFLLHRVEETENEIEIALSLIKEKKPRGIIFLGGYLSSSEKNLCRIEVPFVFSTAEIEKEVDKALYSCVGVDDFKESYKVVDYLCSCGHKKIALLCAPVSEGVAKQRYLGYTKALEQHKIEVDEQLIYIIDDTTDIYTMENGYKATKKLLQLEGEFTALFAISDSIAIGACKAIFDSGKRIPQDYSVAGFDGLDIAKFYHPSITTIKQPVEDMAHETIRILFDRIEKNCAHQHKIFEAELLIRESTKKENRRTGNETTIYETCK